ncbi:sugar-binding domain-containing protein [Gorillibacterium massiliense]|uniref:sugar-binding domain-containing protein n=1 Tax=Gorillibacterium massiliense TaxID=1280390 RepID=UPI00192E731B|nr:sugar-binding domain-containing protein [Gorillibacterium massiliense]
MTLFNDGWFFSKQPLQTEFKTISSADESIWSAITLPHDWLIYNTGDLYENGEGWYRKSFAIDEIASDNRMSLRFEGVYMNSTVFVNGSVAGTWKYGYSTFEFDITPYLKAGENEVYVQVIHESPNSRWYSGAGIYRNVWLNTYPDTHIATDGIYIVARKTEENWSIDVATEVVIGTGTDSVSSANRKVRHTVLDSSGTLVVQEESAIPADVAGLVVTIPTRLTVEQPELWDLENPRVYKMKTELLADGVVTDTEIQNFGFRTLAFDSEKGFFLNGQYVKLHGVCQHHDLGSLGAAVNKAALRRQIELLKEMGVNSIRTAHNMPAVELMDLADEMGVLIVSEAFDMWERPKTPFDYARFFPEWKEKDVASWVRRDRNRPSLLMWSIGNEIYDTHAGERGQELTRELMELVLAHDSEFNAYVTIGSNFMPWENAQKCAEIVKFAGYNYAEKYYEAHHAEHPDWIIYGSETSSTVQSRGIYHFPLAQSVLSDDDEQCSSLGNSSTSWGAKNTEACIIADRDARFSPGQFIWTGFDYIGEPTPYHTKNSYFGQLDTAGFKKDSYYIYQAEWTDYRKAPMVHIFPYWDFSEGQLIDIRVASNAPKVELFVNDVSQGVVCIDHEHGQKLLGEWQLPYAKGILKAVAYDEYGAKIASDTISSFGDATGIVLTPDKIEYAADGSDLIFVEISAKDAEGNQVENANNRVQLCVEGPGRLIGLDNGDSTDYEPYKGTSRRLFSGKLLAVIASTGESGTVTVRVTSPGIEAGEAVLTAVPVSQSSGDVQGKTLFGYSEKGISATDEQKLRELEGEIPVRKLEIVFPQGNRLSKEQTTIPVQVKIHPENATYQDLEWRITTVAGIDANIAKLQADGHKAAITSLGDGKVYVRVATKNGADKIRLYSLMEVEITGMGQAFINPFEFVSAGFHSPASANLTNGNERGVATARDGESRVVFENIDFGDYGSDEITLPIFSLDNDEFTMDLWEGVPGEADAALLTVLTHQQQSQWNVYQEATYTLPKRLKGIVTITFVLRRKIHLKGFQFKPQKAFAKLNALENSQVYGDTFTVTGEAIENIGNNVSLVFKDMEFGTAGSSKLVICGHSPLDKNTIHIQFSGPQGESKQIVEFPYSDGYVEREFALEPVTGQQTVTFVFLPGSQFDFKWFQFAENGLEK